MAAALDLTGDRLPSEPVVDQAPVIAPFDAGATDFPVRPLATCLVEQLEQAH